MSYEIPAGIAHVTQDDAARITALLKAIFKDDTARAAKYMNERSDYFGEPPITLLKRDVLGVVRLIDYLKDVPVA